MSIGEVCNRDVVIADRSDSILNAVRLMRKYHVGDVVVVEEKEGHRRPIGILTDRDIVVELLAAGVDLDALAISDAMSFDLWTLRESDDLLDSIERMQRRGVRRAPVVDDRDALVGILTVDNIIDLISEQLRGVTKLIGRERSSEERRRP